MKRLRAIVRCVYHAFLPPFIERWKNGNVHYQKNPEYSLSYVGHMRLNLKAAYDLLIQPGHLSDEDKDFHKIKTFVNDDTEEGEDDERTN